MYGNFDFNLKKPTKWYQPVCLSQPEQMVWRKWPLVSQNLINKWQLQGYSRVSFLSLCCFYLFVPLLAITLWLGSVTMGTGRPYRALTHRWVMTLKGNYVGYVVLVKNSPPKFFSAVLLLMGRLWLDNGGEENPSSYWYWHLGISHLRLKGSIWFIHLQNW